MTDMLTAKEMQEILHVDRSTIYRMAEAGRLPAMKVGRQWRFPENLVNDWLHSQTDTGPVTPQPAPAATTPAQPNANFADLLPLDCVQLIQDTFAEALGVMIIITNLEGEPVTEISNPCGLFSVISQQPDALAKCLEDWRALAQTIDLEPKLTPSHLGPLCARAMIRVGASLKGMVFVGGIAPANWPPSPAQTATIAARFGLKPAALEAHLEEVFYLDPAEQKRVLTFVQRIANIIAHIINERNNLLQQMKAVAL